MIGKLSATLGSVLCAISRAGAEPVQWSVSAGGNGHLYGEVRFFEFLTDLRGLGAAEVKEAIVKDVNRFSQPIGARDDLTILVLRRFE